MSKEVVLLKHINLENNDTKVLGCFYKKDIESSIKFYKTLPGFSEENGKFDYAITVETEKDYVYLLQIWEDEEYVLFENLYNTRKDSNYALEKYLTEHKDNTYESIVEKHTINKKQWSDGFVTICD